MGSLSDIFSVNITTSGVAVQRPGFGVPLIADFHTRFSERVRWYNSLAGMLSDGFTVNDGAYRAAAAVSNQRPSVTRWAIGRRALAPDLQIDFTPIVQNLTTYKVDLLGPAGLSGTASYTSDGTATVAEITAGLVAAINTLALGIVATDLSTAVRLKAASPGLHFCAAAQNDSLLNAAQTHADPGIATDLAAILTETQDFYGVSLSTGGSAEIVAAAAWVESNGKQGAFASQDTALRLVGSGDVGSLLKSVNEFRSFVQYGRRAGFEFGAIATLGKVYPFNPGATTFKFQQLAGVTKDTLTETDLTNLNNKNVMWFTDFGGIGITGEGHTAAGEWADVIRDRDWFVSLVQTDAFAAAAAAAAQGSKIPFTDNGLSVFEGMLRGDIEQGIRAGFLAPSPLATIAVPLVKNISTTDKGNRRPTGLTFSAPLAGAIHGATISGTITT
jgi:Protein of unknown function (DUF3383)